ADVAGQPAHQQLTDLPCAPIGLLVLDGDDARFDLGRQLIGESHRSARAVGDSLKPVLFVAVEDLVPGFTGDSEVAADLGHSLAIQETGDKSQAFVHNRTLFPRNPHPPAKSGKCNPCVRYELSPMSRAAHVSLATIAPARDAGAARSEAATKHQSTRSQLKGRAPGR